MPRDNRLRARLNENFHYDRGLGFCDILDVFNYTPKGRYFHTVDGRFARIWKLSTFPADVLTAPERFDISDRLVRVLNAYPDGSSGQILHFTHRDVASVVNRYLDGSRAKDFGVDIINAIARRQLDGAQHGFFADISAEQISAAKSELAREGGLDAEASDAMFVSIDRSITSGRFALLTDLYLVYHHVPSWLKLGYMVGNNGKKLLSTLGLYDIKRDFRRTYDAETAKFLKICSEIENKAANMGYQPASMSGQALLNVLYRELNPRRSLKIPPPEYRGDYLIREHLDIARDPQLPDIAKQSTYSMLKTGRDGWQVDGVHYKVVSAKVLPRRIRPGHLSDVLAYIEGEHWCVLNFSVPRQGIIRNVMKVKRGATDQSTAGEWMNHPLLRGDAKLHQEKEEDINFVANAINVENIERDKVIDCAVHVVVKSDDELEAIEAAEKVTSLMWDSGFREVNRGDAMIHQCIPLNYRPKASGYIERALRCMATNVGDLAPVFTSYSGINSPGMLVNNVHGEPIFIDLFAVRAAHGFIQGSTGSGKSFLFNNILMQLQKYDPKIILVDKGGSYKSQCQALGGDYIDLALDTIDGQKPTCINPFYTSPGAHLTMEDLEFMRDIVIAMIECGTNKTYDDKIGQNLVLESIKQVFEKVLPAKRKADPKAEIVLTDVFEYLSTSCGADGKNIALRFKEFTKGYPYGDVFDGKLGLSWSNDFIVLETQRMSGSKALPVVMMALFQQVHIQCKHVKDKKRYAVFAVDEAWAALTSPTAATAIAGFFREFRKYRTGCLLLSQTLRDITRLVKSDNSGSDGILQNTRHFFLMPSATTDHIEARDVLHFDESQLAAWRGLASLPPFYTECFYHMLDDKDRAIDGVFRLYSNPIALWTATTDPVDAQMRDDLFREYEKKMPKSQARARVINELAKKYPFGYRYHEQKESRVA